jgi:hypothetical protein
MVVVSTGLTVSKSNPTLIKWSSFFGHNLIGELDFDRCLTSTDENPVGCDQLLDIMILADRFEMDSLKVTIFQPLIQKR